VAADWMVAATVTQWHACICTHTHWVRVQLYNLARQTVACTLHTIANRRVALCMRLFDHFTQCINATGLLSLNVSQPCT
jgi:hypothetical protein